jgi:hypothetical protein
MDGPQVKMFPLGGCATCGVNVEVQPGCRLCRECLVIANVIYTYVRREEHRARGGADANYHILDPEERWPIDENGRGPFGWRAQKNARDGVLCNVCRRQPEAGPKGSRMCLSCMELAAELLKLPPAEGPAIAAAEEAERAPAPCPYGGGGGVAVSTCVLSDGHPGPGHVRRQCQKCGAYQIAGKWPPQPGWDPAACVTCGALYEGEPRARARATDPAENPPPKPDPQVPENTGVASAQTEVPENDHFPARISARTARDPDADPGCTCLLAFRLFPAGEQYTSWTECPVHAARAEVAACAGCGHLRTHHVAMASGPVLCWCGCRSGVAGTAIEVGQPVTEKAPGVYVPTQLAALHDERERNAADAGAPEPAPPPSPPSPTSAPEVWGICDLNHKPHVLFRDHKCVGWVS